MLFVIYWKTFCARAKLHPHTYLFPTFIKNIEWEESPNYLCQMSCNFQLICVETCVIAILRNLFSFIFQSLLMAIGTAFLYNVDEFKIYSTYCANHSKAQKALHQSELFNKPLSLMNYPGGILRGISTLLLIAVL